MRQWLVVAALTLPIIVIAPGCGDPRDDGGGDGDADSDGDADGDCTDQDGDHAGVGPGCTSDDCDDHDPGLIDECGTDCSDHPERTGCPCEAGSVVPCYRGPEGTAGRGGCVAGIQSCRNGVWSSCEGQTLPSDEACNEEDDDCDGEIDNGVVNECGTCGECNQDCAGPRDGCSDWAEEESSSGIVETPDGFLTLGGTTRTLHVMWPSSSGTGEIFKVNTETLAIEGGYFTGPNGVSESPSRTAVDDWGNVIVANRAFGLEASMTKIAASESDCPDRNQNGIIDTSHDWDDKLAFSAADDWEDECILWHTSLGFNTVARAVAIHTVVGLDGGVEVLGWVGLFNSAKFVEFNVETGELTGREAPTPGFTPYGGALDRDGWLWASGLGSLTGRFDTNDPEGSFETMAMPNNGTSYRVIVDENNNPWVSGTDAWRFNRDTEEWDAAGLSGGFGVVGGIASDGQGSIWVGSYASEERVYRVANDDTLEWHTIDTPGVGTFGMAVDFDGHAWTFGYSDGTAAVIDLESEEVEHVFTECNGPCLNYPYVRGDITGLQRRNALNPAGTWSHLFEGCGAPSETTWTQVAIDAEIPVGSEVSVRVKTGEDPALLANASWIAVGNMPPDVSPLSLSEALERAGAQPHTYLLLEIQLASSDRETAPVLREVRAMFGCSGVFE